MASLAAGRNVDEAFAQASRWRPRVISMATEAHAAELGKRLRQAGVTGVNVVHGSAGTVACSTLAEADFVVSAIVGVAGLEATHAAILAGKPVGLANKECMVAAGEILTAAARERNVPILPIDSEHNAVHQCMRVGAHNEVKTIWLTASGGPFRQYPLEKFDSITPEQALKHPTWVMGYDLDPIACIDNRHRFYREAIPQQWLVAFTHDPKTPLAYVTKTEDGKYEAKPVE